MAARLLAQGRPAEAAERLAALVAEAPVYAAAHVLHATALEAAGRPDDALAAWGRAAVLVPSSPLVHRERRRLLEGARPPGEAPEPAPPDAAPPDAEPDDEAEAYDLRAVDERFLWDDDEDEDAAPPEPADVPPELLPPETPGATDLPTVTPETVGGAGWAVLAEEDGPPADSEGGAEADVVPPEATAHPVADELDALISRLEGAPRIRPDPAFDGPAVSFDDGDVEEMASETLAKIYEAQRQYAQAAAVYETLAARQPERADELLRRADEVRQRR